MDRKKLLEKVVVQTGVGVQRDNFEMWMAWWNVALVIYGRYFGRLVRMRESAAKGPVDEEVTPYKEKWERQLLETGVARNEACAIVNNDSSKASAMAEIRTAVLVMCSVKMDKMTSAVNAMQA